MEPNSLRDRLVKATKKITLKQDILKQGLREVERSRHICEFGRCLVADVEAYRIYLARHFIGT